MISGTIVRLDPRRAQALIQPHDGDLQPVAMPLRPDLSLVKPDEAWPTAPI